MLRNKLTIGMDYYHKLTSLLPKADRAEYSNSNLRIHRMEFSQNERYACLITDLHAIVIEITISSLIVK